MLCNKDPPISVDTTGAGVATTMTETVEVTVAGVDVSGIMIVGVVVEVGVTEAGGVGREEEEGTNREEVVARTVDPLPKFESPGIGRGDRLEAGLGGKVGAVREAVGVGRSGTVRKESA